MVAPVQGTVGKTSNDAATQDYLTELKDFYNKPENEGVKSEFTAPDGSKFEITDASYLSKVTSNVNTGKLDVVGAQDTTKAVAPNADMNLSTGTNATTTNNTKANNSNPAQSDYEKNKDKAAKSQNEGENQANAADSGSKGAESAQKGQGQQEGVDTAPNNAGATGATAVGNQDAALEASKKKGVESQKKLKEEKQKGKQEDAKLTATTQKIKAGFKAAMTKLDAKIQTKKSEESSKAENPAEMAEDAETQNGDKMGFEGKLMTTGGGVVSGGESTSTDQAWEQSMQGPKNQLNEKFTKQEAELQNVKAAGDKAAETFNKQAEATDQAASSKLDSAQGKTWTASGSFVGAAVSAVEGTVSTVSGVKDVGTGSQLMTTSATLAAGVYTAPLAPAVAAAGGAMYTKAVVQFGKAVLSFASAVVTTIAGCRQLKDAKKDREDKEKLNDQADEQREQGGVARRKAVEQTNKANAQTLQATSEVNNMMSSLSSSELPSVTVENKDQLEEVKKDRYDTIMNHEKEHAAIIGGSPVINTDSQGIATGGYVQIDVPSLDEGDLEGTIAKAQKVVAAALAPSNPSSQDQNIASQAKSVLERAQSLLEKKVEEAKEGKEKKEEEPKKEETKEVKEIKDEAKK